MLTSTAGHWEPAIFFNKIHGMQLLICPSICIYNVYDMVSYHRHMPVLDYDSIDLNVSLSSKWVSLYVPSLKEPLEANKHVIDPTLVGNCKYCLISLQMTPWWEARGRCECRCMAFGENTNQIKCYCVEW